MIVSSLTSSTPKRRYAFAQNDHAKQQSPVDQFSSATAKWKPISQVQLQSLTNPPTEVAPAEDYNRLMNRKEGWTGADGAYSVPLNNGSTLWLYSDTFWGKVDTDGSRAPGVKFINNSVGIQSPKGRMEFLHGGGEGDPKSVFTPPDGKGWFWLHDAVVEDSGKVNVLLGQFDKSDGGGALGFEATGAWVAEMELTEDGPKVSEYVKLPHFRQGGNGESSLFLGSSVMREGPYLYVYGVSDRAFERNSVVGRVKADKLKDSGAWEFFDGEGWSSKSEDAQAIAPEVSVEYSVHRSREGDFVMVTQKSGLSPEVQIRRSPRPEGPWAEPKTVWTAPEQEGADFTYNAKAHPELSDERGLLISYNVNSTDWNRNLSHADVYRPRFIRVNDPSLLP